MNSSKLAPNPKLRDVSKLIKNSSKDVDFLKFFDANTSGLYLQVRHRYNQLVDITADGISHLKLFTKFLKNQIDAQQVSSESCLTIVEQYREEEPTLLNVAGIHKLADEASVSDEKQGLKKTDIDAFSDIFGFERNMAKLLVMYWKRLNSEIYEPLYAFRKQSIIKLESVQEQVSIKYDKLIKAATKLRELKVESTASWNDLCDSQHTLRKARVNAPDSNKTKKVASRVKSQSLKIKKQFENVVESVDKFNNLQDEFWNEVIRDACLQLEAINFSRICFYQEYFDKYHDLLEWRKKELDNGYATLKRAREMMLCPYEIVEFGIHPIRIDHGNYVPIPAQQYELPCMPSEIGSLQGKITEQRIDPQILNPVFNPFGDELKPSTSKHIKTNYSRTRVSSIALNAHSRESTMVYHEHNKTQSLSMSVSSISSPNNMTAIASPNAATWQIMQNNNDSKLKLFSRTNKSQVHVGGLPRPMVVDDEDSHSNEFEVMSVPSPSMHSNGNNNNGNVPFTQMKSTKSADIPQLPPRKPNRKIKSFELEIKSRPSLPQRPPPKGNSLSINKLRKPPKLPPRSIRSKTINDAPKINNKNNVKIPSRPPSKSALEVAKKVRRKSSADL